METLNKRFTPNLVANTKIEFILTVPAVWSDVAKNATLEAAKSAGMDSNIRVISGEYSSAMQVTQSADSQSQSPRLLLATL